MSVSVVTTRSVPAKAELLVLPAFVEQDPPDAVDAAVLTSRGFTGAVGTVQVVSGAERPVAVVGLGPADEVTPAALRRAGVAIARAACRHKAIASDVLGSLPDGVDQVAAAQAYAEGLVLGAYSYTELKSDPKPNLLRKVTEVGASSARVSAAVDRGVAIAEAVCFARDLVNEPGGSLTPPKMAQAAARMARKAGLKAKVMDKTAIEKAKLGGLLGVNRGSLHPPRLVQLTYEPDVKPVGTLALVGKGITFDAGGLSIKTGKGMMTMKCDMGGGAAVLGAMMALPAVKPKARVVGYVPMTDNMLGPDATRPGDVLTIRNRKTVEVLNTDAEGRLILADALSLAAEAEPDAIIDLATLTGACMAALGLDYAGLMANHEGWRDQVAAAADAAAEPVWPLPLPADYRKLLDSPVADLKNIGGPYAGALTAGLFLQEFVDDDIAWAHLDIAGPAFTEADHNTGPKGGTGYAVRILVELAANFTRPQKKPAQKKPAQKKPAKKR
ncbi:MAG: leucyl aminopeptidase [Acidimicrobiales bacterium]|nr:leucyl aminopeptidase [Acidimicrobiales bacterium]